MKDYASYFKPSLDDARLRNKEKTQVIKDSFEIPEAMKGVGINKHYFIRTYGCQANERDTETMEGILEAMGYTKAKSSDEADVILLNTCAIRENAEQKVFGKIGGFKALKNNRPDVILGLCGCMAQEESVVETILKKYHHVNLVFGTHNIHRLPQLLQEAMFSNEKVIEVWSKEGDIVENLPSTRASDLKAWVNIMYGCDKFCTYCIVPYTRGKERSRLKDDVLKEVKELKEAGYLEITLLGQNVNAYGKDFEEAYDFGHLLEDVAKIGIPRIRFTTSHPWDFSLKMIEVIRDHLNIMPYIHLPVQSGNTEILKLMGRKYSRESYLKLFDEIKAMIPHVAFSTDVIVGFPNETDEQFKDTLSLMEHCQFDNAYTFVYSPRIGTPAAKMADNIDMKVKEDRLQQLNHVVNQFASKKNHAYVGQIVEVLVEGPSKKDPNILSGYSEHNKLVNFTGDASLIGTMAKVKITTARTWFLIGEAVES